MISAMVQGVVFGSLFDRLALGVRGCPVGRSSAE